MSYKRGTHVLFDSKTYSCLVALLEVIPLPSMRRGCGYTEGGVKVLSKWAQRGALHRVLYVLTAQSMISTRVRSYDDSKDACN